MNRDELRDRIAEIITRQETNGLCPLDGPCGACDCLDPAHRIQRDLADAVLEVIEDEALDRMANKLLEETNLRAMDFRNGMSMDIEPARALAANFVGAARAMLGDAPNYSETPVEMTTSLAADPGNPATREKFAFIVQRIGPGKLTPHEARMAAERRADEAEAELVDLEGVLADIGVVRLQLQAEVERLRAALEEIKLRTVQRDLNRLAAAALNPPAEPTGGAQ